MSVRLKKPAAAAIPIHAVDTSGFAAAAAALPPAQRRWLQSLGFKGAADTFALLPAEDGRLAAVWAGVQGAAHPYALSLLPRALPEGSYRLAEDGLALDAQAAAMSWALGSHAFERYRKRARAAAQLQLASSDAARRGLVLAESITMVRDLVNTPAEDLGPAELAAAAQGLAKDFGARFRQVVGDALLAQGLPAIHAVGRAADAKARAPRLIELTWGKPRHPRVTLVGKGVCFDSGGLDLKSADGMRLMKKDMGGAANVLGLARMIMALALPLRLQVLIPAVENSISGNALRPGDVLRTRKGIHIEIGNTDAEGRVILCDALAVAAEGKPELMIDLATLTGAARVALGPHLPALFCRDTAQARELVDRGLALHDPLWHLPLWTDYHDRIESDIADIVNTGKGPMAGAVTAALFLADFVPADQPWLHVDLFAWNDAARPGRPVGGEAQALRTLLDHLERHVVRR
ncbi:MAG: leucyl aminopeptidase [Rubrivivax sp. SCN 71-131]|jgi:leucyl aminopeptidase|nr:MAG: leucyl aminopeptidase [Rubrivivax sp. SCN 71-131]